MIFQDFRTKCEEIFAHNSAVPMPTQEQIEKLFDLTNIMLEVNKSMNLTAITEENAIILRHYVDCASICGKIPEKAKLIDVGCGAGFPSLVLAIFRPDVEITGLDGTAKRIDYVNSTAKKLGLNNVTAIAARAEEAGKNAVYREKFDVVTARAVASLPVLCEICLPFAKVGGKFIAMKASQGQSEVATASQAITLCGGNLSDVELFSISPDGREFEQRTVINIAKSAPTPQKYPRHYSQISKKPL